MAKCDGIKKQVVLIALLFLGCLIFSGCSRSKPESKKNDENPFGITSNTKTGILQPCHWTYEVEQTSPGEVTLISTAKLDSGWHLYSQHMPAKGSPKTTFAYADLPEYKLVGETEEEKPLKEYNPYLEMEVLYFEDKAEFKQKIKVSGKEDFTINGTIDYMVCLEQCVKLDEEFGFKVKGNTEGK